MIIYTREDLIVGSFYPVGFIYDKNKNRHDNVPIKVLREASEEEYIEYCKENNCLHLVNWNVMEDAKFYEISTD